MGVASNNAVLEPDCMLVLETDWTTPSSTTLSLVVKDELYQQFFKGLKTDSLIMK